MKLAPILTFFSVVLAKANVQKCGKTPILDKSNLRGAQYRIVGGENATPGEIPWQVALFYEGRHKCGASIISAKWILTAAHCIKYSSGVYLIRAGEYNLKGNENTEQEIPVLRIEKHPDFHLDTYNNDIALMELETELTFTKYVQPICLPEPDEVPKRSIECYVTGWGKVKDGVPRSSVLQQIVIPVYDFNTCKKEYDEKIPDTKKRDHPRVNTNMICAGYPEGNVDACQGDSGGPLACPLGDRMILYGITSWGIGCAGAFPGYYARVGKYVPWIRDVISGKAAESNKDPCRGGGVVIKGENSLTIQTTGFDGKSKYKSDSHCTWTIEIPGNISTHGAMIKFTDFGLEKDSRCSYDYLKIFSGENADELLGTYCGSDIPIALRARGALKFKVVFHSDDSFQYKGFRAHLNRFKKGSLKDSNCGSLSNIKTRRKKLFPKTGSISSVKYPESYSANTECIWKIRAMPGERIELTFEDTRLEVPNANNNCSDSITVYDTKSAKPGKEIGSSVCGTHKDKFSLVSTGRHMTVVFKSDNESESSGFKASYRSVEATSSEPRLETPDSLEILARSLEEETESDDICGRAFYDMSYDDGFGRKSMLVEGVETVANSIPWTAHVEFCFTDPNSDDEDIISCRTCDGTLIDKKWVATVAHCFKEGSVTKSLKIILGDHDKDVTESSEVEIDAERYVLYPNYTRSKLIVNDIALIELKDPVKFSRMVRPICLPSPDVCFKPGTVCISAGWGGAATYGANAKRLRRAQVPLYAEDNCFEAVGRELHHDSMLCAGFKKGPNNPDQCGPEAGGGLMCRSSPDQPWILYGMVSCGYGCVYPGCPSMYTRVSWLSDWITEQLGYNITVPPGNKDESCIFKQKRQAEKDLKNDPCKNLIELSEAEGVIESLNYPDSYKENLFCQWKIKAQDPKKYIKITFRDFDVEGLSSKCSDSVTILNDKGEIVRNEFCNTWKPAVPILALGGASIQFKTDKSGNFGGFSLAYEETDSTTIESNCGGASHLKNSGKIQSLGHPQNYPDSTSCLWLLEAAEGKYVELKFETFSLEDTASCAYDFVEIWESNNRGNHLKLIGRLCGELEDFDSNTFNSTSGWMLIRFKSDSSGRYGGFVGTFQSLIQ